MTCRSVRAKEENQRQRAIKPARQQDRDKTMKWRGERAEEKGEPRLKLSASIVGREAGKWDDARRSTKASHCYNSPSTIIPQPFGLGPFCLLYTRGAVRSTTNLNVDMRKRKHCSWALPPLVMYTLLFALLPTWVVCQSEDYYCGLGMFRVIASTNSMFDR